MVAQASSFRALTSPPRRPSLRLSRGMLPEKEACAECTRNCLLIHGKKRDPSPVMTSFFKVMIRDDFSRFMFLPPRFVRTVGKLHDKKINLEDANGQQWEVTVSNVDGSLAFKEGWCEFSQDHGLEIGDFLVFYYIMGSHFIVQIWGKTGCEKLNFPEGNVCRKTKSRRHNKVTAANGILQTVKANSMNKQGSSSSLIHGSSSDIKRRKIQELMADRDLNLEAQNGMLKIVPRTGYMEPFYMPDRDIECSDGEDRSYLCDLSRFEINCRPNADAQNHACSTDERCRFLSSKPMLCPAEASSEYRDLKGHTQCRGCLLEGRSGRSNMLASLPPISEETLFMSHIPPLNGEANCFRTYCKLSKDTDLSNKNSKSWGRPLDVPDPLMIEKGSHGPMGDEITLTSERYVDIKRRDGTLLCTQEPKPASERSSENYWILDSLERNAPMLDKDQILPSDFAGASDFSDSPIATSGREPMQIKEDGENFILVPVDNKINYGVVKPEPIESLDLFLPDEISIPISVVIESRTFLELPASHTLFLGGRQRVGSKVIYLRDPKGRLWPVLYQEKQGIKALTSGWQHFKRENRIQSGDECVFRVEDKTESIYSAFVIHK